MFWICINTVKSQYKKFLFLISSKINAFLLCWVSGTHLNFIVVKWMVSSQRTIESCFEKRCPIVFEDPLSTLVIFTHSCNSWVDSLPAIWKLNCVFTKYKINKLLRLKCQHKVGLGKGFCVFIFSRSTTSPIFSHKKKDKVLQKIAIWKLVD